MTNVRGHPKDRRPEMLKRLGTLRVQHHGIIAVRRDPVPVPVDEPAVCPFLGRCPASRSETVANGSYGPHDQAVLLDRALDWRPTAQPEQWAGWATPTGIFLYRTAVRKIPDYRRAPLVLVLVLVLDRERERKAARRAVVRGPQTRRTIRTGSNNPSSSVRKVGLSDRSADRCHSSCPAGGRPRI